MTNTPRYSKITSEELSTQQKMELHSQLVYLSAIVSALGLRDTRAKLNEINKKYSLFQEVSVEMHNQLIAYTGNIISRLTSTPLAGVTVIEIERWLDINLSIMLTCVSPMSDYKKNIH